LLRQMITESLLLAALGGGFGIAVAAFGVRALVALSPPGLPRINAITIDASAIAFAIGITTVIGLAVGLIPALQVSRDDLHVALQQSSQRTTGGHQLTRRALVVAEVALALVLLVSAGLLLRSLNRLFSIDPGFNTSHMVTMQVQMSGPGYDDEKTNRFFAQAAEKVREIPGVTGAAFTSQLPLSGDLGDGYGVHFESSPTGNPESDNGAFRYAVSPGYIEAMAIPLRSGRLLDEQDKAGAPPAVLISESLARSKFPSHDPIGQRLKVGPNDGPWYTIAGVVGNVKQTSLSISDSDAVYITNEQWRLFTDGRRWLVVRSRDNAAALTPAVEQAIWSVDKDQPIARIATMDDRLAASAAERRFSLILFELFGVIALVLAAVGIYGVLAGSVSERTREIGVRLALGAQRRDVLALILGQGLKLTLSGVALGLVAAWAATRLLINLLYGISATDPLSFGGVALLLIGVALVACYLPAHRATRVDPLTALRHE